MTSAQRQCLHLSCPGPSGSPTPPPPTQPQALGTRRASRAGQPGEWRSLSAVFSRALGRSPHFCIISSSRSHVSPVPVSSRPLTEARQNQRRVVPAEGDPTAGPGGDGVGAQRGTADAGQSPSSRPRPGVMQGLGWRQCEGFQQTGGGRGWRVLRAGVEAEKMNLAHSRCGAAR